MLISSRFTIAVHVLICMEVFKNERKITSEFLASSVNVNSVVIRRLLQQLKKAGLVEVKRGTGGAKISKELKDITLLDIYRAVENNGDGHLFRFHNDPNPKCPVGKNIHNIMDKRLEEIQEAMESKMNSTSLEDIINDAGEYID